MQRLAIPLLVPEEVQARRGIRQVHPGGVHVIGPGLLRIAIAPPEEELLAVIHVASINAIILITSTTHLPIVEDPLL